MTEEPQGIHAITLEMQRKAEITKDLMIRGMESLIRTTLHPPHAFLSDASREFRPELRLIMRIRESGLGSLEHGESGLTLKIYGISATAPSVRGALWEWAEISRRTERGL